MSIPHPFLDVQGAVDVGCGETEEEKLGQGLIAPESGKKPEAQTKTKQSRKPPRAWSQLRKPKETDKKNRHPFALYGGGDKPAEMARKKTHNVGPAASTKEVITHSQCKFQKVCQVFKCSRSMGWFVRPRLSLVQT